MTGWNVFMAIISCDILMCGSEARQNQQMEATPCLFVHPTEGGAHLIILIFHAHIFATCRCRFLAIFIRVSAERQYLFPAGNFPFISQTECCKSF